MSARLNLLPTALSRRLLMRRELRRFAAVCVVVAAGGMLLSLAQSRFYALTRARLDELERMTSPQRAQEIAAQAVADESRRIEDELAGISQLEQRDVPLTVLSVVGECCRTAGTAVLVDRFRMEEFVDASSSTAPRSTASPPEAAANLPVKRRRLQITGMALDDRGVAALVVQLRAHGMFRTVDLDSSQTIERGQRAIRQFQLRCTF